MQRFDRSAFATPNDVSRELGRRELHVLMMVNKKRRVPFASPLFAAVHSIQMRDLCLALAAILLAMFVQLPPALSQKKERSATVTSGEKVRIWFGANYAPRWATAGPPIFNLVSKPSLGEVATELAEYTVPSGQNRAGRTYTGVRIWRKAGAIAGTDTFKYTIEFPHEPSNPTPSKGPQPVTVTVVVQ